MKRLGKVSLVWSANLAYAIGLIASDGNLSPDGRHINLTSKDEEMIQTFKKCLGLKNRVGRKSRGGFKDKKYYVLQFGDRNFYDFLLALGLMPAKSKVLAELEVPETYFADFFRGCIDGDGNIDIHKHAESRHLQLKMRLCSASLIFLEWIKREITKYTMIHGGWIEKNKSVYTLCFGKADSIKISHFMYYDVNVPCLKRKRNKVKRFLRVWPNW
ncbi:MAG: LAGLIDADG family homing endonuclease [Patescibacteria group bacterium]